MGLDIGPFITAFLGCGVEATEALTIVLAVGLTRGWREPLLGTVTALVLLAVPVVLFGQFITAHVPEATLKLVIGTLILLFGVRWLRKAILRSGGVLALHDEAAAFESAVKSFSAETRDWLGFVIAFKAVLLEGLEGAFIVFAVGSSSQRLGSAAAGGVAALIAVVAAGVVVRRPLARVPENTLKFGVGLILSSLGTFWAAEGLGFAWPLDLGSIAPILAIYLVAARGAVTLIRRDRLAEGAQATS